MGDSPKGTEVKIWAQGIQYETLKFLFKFS